MRTEPFEWPHGRHATERVYAADGKTPVAVPFDGACEKCRAEIRSKVDEVVPLVRDVARAMARERRKFCTTAEMRRACDWFVAAFPWQLSFWAEGATRHYALGRKTYKTLTKSFIIAFETLAVARAGTLMGR